MHADAMVLFTRKLLGAVSLGASAGYWHVSADPSADSCDETYDFIVVGSGPGGGVVGSRLARAGFDTLILDAGPDYGSGPTELDVQVPLLWPASTINPALEWAFSVKNTDDAEQLDVLYPRSSNIGGCAAHNAMQSAYPYADFYTKLAWVTGDAEFDEDKMRERFTRIEKNEYFPIPQDESTGHGTAGFTSTSFGDPRLTAADLQFQNVLGYLGTLYPGPVDATPFGLPGLYINPDINGVLPAGSQAPGTPLNIFEGLHFCPAAISPENGFRRSGVYGLIKETERDFADTLTVKPKSFVTKILFKDTGSSEDGNEPEAFGVMVQEGTALYQASTGNEAAGDVKIYCASKEVIVAGGAFNTPQILKLSGIGPEEELEDLDIDVVADLPGVGKNLRDKLEVTLNFEMNQDWGIYDALGDLTPEALGNPALLLANPAFQQYLQGNFDTPNPFTATGVFFSIMKKSVQSPPGEGRPDIYLQVSPSYFERYQPGWFVAPFTIRNALTINIATATSGTDGEVKLASDDPFEQASIDFGGFTNVDLTKVAEQVQQLSTQMLAPGNLVAGQLRPPLEGQDAIDLGDIEDVKEWVRKNGWGHHACCSAKIGADDDDLAVLDGQFKVRGVQNLRVVDASAFPEQPGFFPTIGIMMLAEKAADDIIALYD